jgi:hypothetical protein
MFNVCRGVDGKLAIVVEMAHKEGHHPRASDHIRPDAEAQADVEAYIVSVHLN